MGFMLLSKLDTKSSYERVMPTTGDTYEIAITADAIMFRFDGMQKGAMMASDTLQRTLTVIFSIVGKQILRSCLMI